MKKSVHTYLFTLTLAFAASFSALPLQAAGPSPSASPSGSPAASPASGTAPATSEYDASNLAELRPLLNQTVTITGTVDSQGESKAGTVRFLHFTKDWNQSVALVFFVKNGEPSHDQLLNFIGKKIKVSGKLIEYQKQLEFKLESTSVIEILP